MPLNNNKKLFQVYIKETIDDGIYIDSFHYKYLSLFNIEETDELIIPHSIANKEEIKLFCDNISCISGRNLLENVPKKCIAAMINICLYLNIIDKNEIINYLAKLNSLDELKNYNLTEKDIQSIHNHYYARENLINEIGLEKCIANFKEIENYEHSHLKAGGCSNGHMIINFALNLCNNAKTNYKEMDLCRVINEILELLDKVKCDHRFDFLRLLCQGFVFHKDKKIIKYLNLIHFR